MAVEKSLGVITVTGNGAVRATSNLASPTPFPQIMAHSYRMQRWNGNGYGFVGDETMIPAEGTGVFGMIAPDDKTPWESHKAEKSYNPTDMATVFVDGDTPGDGFLITYVEA